MRTIAHVNVIATPKGFVVIHVFIAYLSVNLCMQVHTQNTHAGQV